VAKILITGASGLIGKRLTEILSARGHQISHLGRSGKSSGAVKKFRWDVGKRFIEEGALENIDIIVHLAGAGIADKPWSDGRKREILESRTLSTRLLFQELKKGNHQVKAFVSASAIGYYGFEDESTLLTEDAPAGNDYLAQVVRKWEEEVDQVSTLGLRVVKIRTGIVLSEAGGALAEMVKPVKFYVGAPLGTGEQNLSWIHIDDLCFLFSKAIEDPSFSGPYNGVGPYPVTNSEFTKAIAQTLRKPLLLPKVPGFVLKLLLGEMAALVLRGSRVSSEKIRSKGFQFKFDTVESALNDLLNNKN
jgi:uncharacterized protein